MFITKKHLSRRTFLRGAGVAVGLPLLDAMVPALDGARADRGGPKPRMGFIYLPHGAIMEQWTPAAEGTGFELTPILKPLAPFQKQLTIVSGLENKPAIAPPVHALNPGTWLSCVTPRVGQEPYGGVTVDQIAARTSARTRRSRRSRSRPKAAAAAAPATATTAAATARTISFRTPTTPLPMESDPRKLFERLFGQGDTRAGAQGDLEAVREHPRPRDARGRRSAEDARRAGSRQARRLPRERARDRAPRAEDGGAGSLQPRPAGRAGRHQRSTSA